MKREVDEEALNIEF